MDQWLGTQVPFHVDYHGDSNSSYNILNGQCIRDPPVGSDGPALVTKGGFKNWFGWAVNATRIGHNVWENRTCEKWYHAKSNAILCMTGDIPVYMDVDYAFANFSKLMRYTFGADYVRTVAPAKLEVPARCTGPPILCGSGAVETMQFYVFHPRQYFNISGQDVADARGEAGYLCGDSLWKAEDYELASLYEVSVLQTFGQYANCNYYNPSFCYGGDGFHVGREGGGGYGSKHAGQCDEDALFWANYGTWYSLPPEGLCTTSSQHIGVDCSWRIERRVKTFEMSCLFDPQHGFQDKCVAARPPLSDVTSFLLEAFASEDPAQGGCPSMAGSKQSAALII